MGRDPLVGRGDSPGGAQIGYKGGKIRDSLAISRCKEIQQIRPCQNVGDWTIITLKQINSLVKSSNTVVVF